MGVSGKSNKGVKIELSLTDWVEWDKELFDILLEKPKLDVTSELKAPPSTKNYGTVGTAFDYALRLLIERENVGVVSHFPLVARQGIKGDKKRKDFINEFDAKHSKYVLSNGITIHELLSDCIVLAKLDAVFRSGRNFPNSDIFRIDDEDVRDLSNLIGLVDINIFKAKTQCYLNPCFGESSKDIGGADADLLIDDCLIDIKTTKNLSFTRSQLRQLLGYHILNLREREILGEINYLGIYYSRHGIMFKFNCEIIRSFLTSEYWESVEDSIKEYHGN